MAFSEFDAIAIHRGVATFVNSDGSLPKQVRDVCLSPSIIIKLQAINSGLVALTLTLSLDSEGAQPLGSVLVPAGAGDGTVPIVDVLAAFATSQQPYMKVEAGGNLSGAVTPPVTDPAVVAVIETSIALPSAVPYPE